MLKVEAAAEAEILEAARWYERQTGGLGDQFLQAVTQVLAAISDHPRSFPLLESQAEGVLLDCRYAFVEKFAYRIAFEVRPGETIVFALAHVRRGEGYWRGRLRGRGGTS